MSGFVGFLDSLLTWVARTVGEPATSFCELETVDSDRRTLVASDGSLANVIAVHGSMRLVGESDYKGMVDNLTSKLTSFMKGTGHSLQVYWVRDPDGSAELVRKALDPARRMAEQLNLNFKDVLDEKERELAKWVSHEAIYFVCWTHPGVLTPMEGKAARRRRDADSKKLDGLRLGDAQNPRVLLHELRNRHSAYVQSMVSELRDTGIWAEPLDGHQALLAMRCSVDPDWTPPDWKAVIPGDEIPVRFPMRATEHSAIWWPPLASQVWPRDAVTIDQRFVRIGDRLHAPMYVDTPPVRIESFQRLVQRTLGLDPKMPWTMSFLLKGNGLKKTALKGALASVFAILGRDNAMIRDALRSLKEFGKSGAVVSFQVCFNTWAPARREDVLRQRASRLAQAVIDWGSAEVREVTGDPVEGFTCTAMGLTSRSIASEAAAPLDDVVRMLPITRPASPWSTGAELFTSVDGKLMPYQPGSSVQQTWISLFLGGPGSGKSMQMFKQHFATCLAPNPGARMLPQIAIIDIGPSSSGLASLLGGALPPQSQHFVLHQRLRNIPAYSINPCDLQLGCERPLPEERSFLVNLMVMLATPAETGVAPEGTAELAGMVIDQMYADKANNERGKPNLYNEHVDPKVDEALRIHSIVLPDRPCWYDVRDLLFKKGDTHAAHLAQRYAVPLIADAAHAARAPSIRSVYAKNEKVTDDFIRLITSAVNEYPILSQPTRFDIGESRVTILDLDEVAKGGGKAGDKQIAVMYMIAMFVLARSMTLTQDNLRDIPDAYKPYHYPRVQAVAKELKTLCCDEFHRIGQSFASSVRDRVKVFAREGRKWNIQLMLGSQRLDDFDEELINMATSIYIMERPDEGLVTQYDQKLGLTDAERAALRNEVKSPRAGGATFFARMKTKEGPFNQLLRNPAGPIELWAGSTTAEDKPIRELVYAALGAVDGRTALAHAYPGGTAKKDVDARKEMMLAKGSAAMGEAEDDLYQVMAQEVIEAFRARRSAEAAGNGLDDDDDAIVERRRYPGQDRRKSQRRREA